MRAPLIALLFCSLAPAQERTDWLVGTWEYSEDLIFTLTFWADGQVAFRTRQGPLDETQKGTWKLETGKLTLALEGATAVYDLSKVERDLFLLSGGDLVGRALDFVRLGDPPRREQAEGPTGLPDDPEWAARFPLAAVKEGPKIAVVGLPDDPRPADVFAEAQVFASHQLYLWNAPDGEAATLWHFFPDGRAFVRFIRSGEIEQHWGRYRIDGDEMRYIIDAGDALDLELRSGRRYLAWEDLVYGNVVWENHRRAD